MKIKLFEADLLSDKLRAALKNTKGLVGYKLSRNQRLLDNELIDYRNAREEIFRKYGTEQDGKITVEKNCENYDLLIKELDQFKDEEIEIEFNLLSEQDIEHSDLTGEQIYMLSKYMIKEDENVNQN